jgi:hypothetical protein
MAMRRESLNHLSFGIETAHSEISITVRQADLPTTSKSAGWNPLAPQLAGVAEIVMTA